jgi:hypothetical protein
MRKTDLQQTAEQVVDLEARIINWQGSITDWSRDIIRLRTAIQNFLDTADRTRDTTQAEFLRQLLHKINRCRENVLCRARWMATRHQAGELKDEPHIHSGSAAGLTGNH